MSTSPAPSLPVRARLPLLLAGAARRPSFWALLLVLGVGLPGLALVQVVRASRVPEMYSSLPAFRFTSQEGQPFGSDELKGRVWVANFIFTRCPSICPRFSSQMAKVQERTREQGAELQLVSFSVDPEYDTPERLKAYAARYKADPGRWTFLTGEYQQLKQMVMDGFKVAMTRESAAPDDFMSIVHGEYFVLVDQHGNIRGYYDAKDAAAVDRLVDDAELLVRAPRS